MPPEAWAGGTATEQSDVYSLGVLLYELCCGHPPHECETLEALSRAATERDAPPLVVYTPSIDRRFAAIIHRCLARAPEERYAKGEQLAQELETLLADITRPSASSLIKHELRRRWIFASAAMLLLILPSFFALWHFYKMRLEQRRATATLKNRRSIAVVGLKEPAGNAQHAGFSAAFASLLSTELAVDEQLRRISAESVARMQIDLKLSRAETYDPGVLTIIRQHLGVDLLVAGSYQAAPGAAETLHVRIGVYDTQSGQRVAAAEVTGSPSALFELVTKTGMELREQLGLGGLSSAQAAALRAARPTSPEVAAHYAEGLDKLRRFDAVGARKLLERVIAADPDYPLGHLAMADVFTALGYDEKAKIEAKRAFDLSGNLPREDRYLIEARYRESKKEWSKAFAAYHTLLTFFPESLEYGLYLVNAQLAAGEPEAAAAMIKKLRELPPPSSQDPRLDIVEARAASDHSDYHAALALLKKAAQKGITTSAPLVVANANLEAAYDLSFVGLPEEARKSAEVARELFRDAANRGGMADALMAIGQSYAWQCDYKKAVAAEEEALSILIDIENSGLLAIHQTNYAIVLGRTGRIPLALARAESSLILSREIGAKEAMGSALIVIGWIEYLRGHLGRAASALENAHIIFQELGDPKMVAWFYWHKGQLLFARDELDKAQQLHEQALQIREQHGLAVFAAESKLALAELALERNAFAMAEADARQAAEAFQKEGQIDAAAGALALLGQALLGQGPAKQKETRSVIESALKLAEKTDNSIVKTKSWMAAARIYAEIGSKSDQSNVSKNLAQLLEDASQMDMLIYALEIRMAMAILNIAANQNDLAQKALAAIVEESARTELVYISRKASALLIKIAEGDIATHGLPRIAPATVSRKPGRMASP